MGLEIMSWAANMDLPVGGARVEGKVANMSQCMEEVGEVDRPDKDVDLSATSSVVESKTACEFVNSLGCLLDNRQCWELLACSFARCCFSISNIQINSTWLIKAIAAITQFPYLAMQR